MPKVNIIPTPVKRAIVHAKASGQSVRAVATLFNISIGEVSQICKQYRTTGTLHRKPKSGRPRITSAQQERRLLRPIRANPKLTSADLVRDAQTNMALKIYK